MIEDVFWPFFAIFYFDFSAVKNYVLSLASGLDWLVVSLLILNLAGVLLLFLLVVVSL